MTKKTIFRAFLVFFLPFSAFSQIKEEFDSIINQYKAKELQKIEEIIDKNRDKRGLAALSLLPNISIMQQVNDDIPFVSAGINISNISTYFQQKRRSNIELEMLEERLLTRLESKIDNFQKEMDILEDLAIKISLSKDLLDIEKKLFEIRSKKYEKNEITLENYLLFQAEFINKTKQNMAEIGIFEARRDNLIRKLSIQNSL